MTKRGIMSIVLTVVMVIGIVCPIINQESKAESVGGWLNTVQQVEFGNAHMDMLSDSDYSYAKGNAPTNYVVDVYGISMDFDGVLNVYFESEDKNYFGKRTGYVKNFYEIYSTSNPDEVISDYDREGSFSAARNVYSNSTEISLSKGTYYLLVGHGVFSNYNSNYTMNTSYTITLNAEMPQINVSSIQLNRKTLSINVGDTVTLIAKIVPSNATDQTLIWESSNPNVVSVSNGEIKGLSKGTVKITVYSGDRVVSSEAKITVNNPEEESDPPQDDEKAILSIKNSVASITSLKGKKKCFSLKMNLSIDSVADDVGFEVNYRLKNKKWKKAYTSNKTIKISKIKSHKKYSVRVRPFKEINNATYYGKWSKTKTVKIK